MCYLVTMKYAAGRVPALDATPWPAPARIELAASPTGDPAISWDPDDLYNVVPSPDGGDLLRDFVRLTRPHRRGPDLGPAVSAFAKRWGTLGQCSVGVCGWQHPPMRFGSVPRLPDRSPVGGPAFERLDEWLRLAKTVNALVRTGMRLREDDPGDPADWELIYWPGRRPVPDGQDAKDRAARIEYDRLDWALGVSRWLVASHVQPIVLWDGAAIAHVMRVGGLQGGLAVEVVAAVTGSVQWLDCVDCHTMFPRLREPSGPPRCDECGDARRSGRFQETRRRDPDFREKEAQRLRAYRARRQSSGGGS